MTLDEVISEFDRGLRSMTVSRVSRLIPVAIRGEAWRPRNRQPRNARIRPGLMRVNHVGEVCAQALYQAQKLATHSPSLQATYSARGR